MVRTDGDWEGWTAFFLECVREAAEDGVDSAKRLFVRVGADRRTVLNHSAATVTAIRLFDALPDHPIITLTTAMKLLKTSKPTAGKAIRALCQARVLDEITGKQRDRVYSYRNYLKVLAEDTEVPAQR
jgi:Fic family protein